MRNFTRAILSCALGVFSLANCGGYAPMPSVAHVDLNRYMGDWYVIASIPSYFERDAFNAVESYTLNSSGKIETTFRYRDGGFDSKLKTLHPIGTVVPESGNAVWGMQFIWPIKAEYVIAWLDTDYRTVIVARSKRDYVWIMAREPSLSTMQYRLLTEKIRTLGYDPEKLRPVPQRWPEDNVH